MTKEDTTAPLINVGLLLRPGVMRCCEDHSTPVFVLTLIVGDVLLQMIVPVMS